MTTNEIGGILASGVTLSGAVYSSPVTVTADGMISGGSAGLYAATCWAIENYGSISATAGYGVNLAADGSVTNEAGGSIAGAVSGVRIDGTTAVVDNAGGIGGGTYGVDLLAGGHVGNAAGAGISGSVFGVKIAGDAGALAGTVVNDGFITAGLGVYLSAGGSVTNLADGAIVGGAGPGVEVANGMGSVVNDGSISGSSEGVYLLDGGSVFNAAGGVITGSIYKGSIRVAGAAGTVVNDGQISGWINLADGGSVTNEAGGAINSGIDAGDVFSTVVNYGLIGGGILLVDGGSVLNAKGGVILYETSTFGYPRPSTITNYGFMSGISANALSLVNAAGATIGRGDFEKSVYAAYGTVVNSGLIEDVRGFGVFIWFGHDAVTNEAGGTIVGGTEGVFIETGTVENAGTIDSEFGDSVVFGDLENIFGYSGAVPNRLIVDPGAVFIGAVQGGGPANTIELVSGAGAGTVGGLGSKYIDFQTVTIDSGADWRIAGTASARVTIENAGTLSGPSYGVALGAGGSVINAAGATISGASYGVIIAGGAGTVENAGTIAGAIDSVYFSYAGANRLILEHGTTFSGKVLANPAGANAIELASSASAGTLSGLGSQYTGFQTVTIDSGAAWTVADTMAGFDGVTIEGFNSYDRLDLTDLPFSSTDRVSLESGSDVLSIYSSGGGTPLDTLQLAGNFTGDFFHLSQDQGNGTDVTEDNVPCYCRGTLILTDKGEVPVEDLRIGDRLVTRSGEARPIKWIGMRSYSGRFARGNRDILPILIRAGALADSVPKRDLWVSPLHAMFLDDVLIPALALVNGTSIIQAETVEQVDYFHLELDTHDVIVAEGALAESFLDDHSRGMFHNAHEYRRLYPDAEPEPALYCAPVVEEAEILEAVRRRIAVRAGAKTATLPGPLFGHLDRVSDNVIEGWAWGAAFPDTPVTLRILDNGVTIGQAVADRPRLDVLKVGIGNGRNGFRFDVAGGLSPWTRHVIQVVRAADGVELTNSPTAFGVATRLRRAAA